MQRPAADRTAVPVSDHAGKIRAAHFAITVILWKPSYGARGLATLTSRTWSCQIWAVHEILVGTFQTFAAFAVTQPVAEGMGFAVQRQYEILHGLKLPTRCPANDLAGDQRHLVWLDQAHELRNFAAYHHLPI